MFSKKVPLLYLVACTVLAAFLTYIFVARHNITSLDVPETATENNKNDEHIVIQRRKGFKYISPIIFAEPANEASEYSELKGAITDYIQKQKATDKVTSASVYVKDFARGNWFAIDAAEKYYPGSLLKVAVLMTYLRMAETRPNLLNEVQEYHVNKAFVFPKEHYQSKTVEEGRKYTISELINYMIKYSDNRATLFLENIMDTTLFKSEFPEMAITEPHFEHPDYMLNAKEYSNIFKALYSGSELRKSASDTALALLTKAEFRQGLLKELPANVTVAHKFGEAGNEQIHELHESGIVYLDNRAYMITVMTRGTDWDLQSDMVGHISKMVYDKMTGGSLVSQSQP